MREKKYRLCKILYILRDFFFRRRNRHIHQALQPGAARRHLVRLHKSAERGLGLTDGGSHDGPSARQPDAALWVLMRRVGRGQDHGRVGEAPRVPDSREGRLRGGRPDAGREVASEEGLHCSAIPYISLGTFWRGKVLEGKSFGGKSFGGNKFWRE